jgi:hypothetical protein
MADARKFHEKMLAKLKPILQTAGAIVIATTLDEAALRTFPPSRGAFGLSTGQTRVFTATVQALICHAVASLCNTHLDVQPIPAKVTADLSKPFATIVGWNWKTVVEVPWS